MYSNIFVAIITLCSYSLVTFISDVSVNCSAPEDNVMESGETIVELPVNDKVKAVADAQAKAYQRPQGCYGPTQLKDMLTLNRSRIKYKPQPPNWCRRSEALIPESMSNVPPQTTDSPYKIQVFQFQKSDAFRVVLKAVGPNSVIMDAIMVARDVAANGTILTNSGRFLRAEGVELICCFFTDKDVGRFRTTKNDIKQVVFYWVPYEETIDDYEGDMIFIATVAKSSKEYWTNVTSDRIVFTPPRFTD